MAILIVVDNPDRWPLQIPGVGVVAARSYLADPRYSELRGAVVFNLCRSYGYQRLGYYVSLLAEARRHRAKPSIDTIQDMRSQVVTRVVAAELSETIKRALAPIKSQEFVLSIYFGKPLAKRYSKLALALFNQFQVPLLRARFGKGSEWQLQHVGPIQANDIPDSHRDFVVSAAEAYFGSRRWTPRRSKPPRCYLALLHDPSEAHPPSNEGALRRFERAAQAMSIDVERITRTDYGRLVEFDALLIRATTAVNHYTYRFARRAEAEGLAVIDDPSSIVRCTNKVFLAEGMTRHRVATPATFIAHRQNRDRVRRELGLPCVLKQPDSAFSQGVIKVDDDATLEQELNRLLDLSELVIAQEFVPTGYDWRVGVFDRKPLYVCRYHMARHHWQIMKRSADGDMSYGRVETIPVEAAPKSVVRTAVRAANLIGDGLYGVDLKQAGRRVLVIEVNDNPNIDAGFEDEVLKQDLYARIVGGMLDRVERRRAAAAK